MIKVIGIRRLDYKNKDGRAVKGYSFYLSEDVENVIGVTAFNSFLSDEAIQPLLNVVGSAEKLLGMNVDLSYNRYGRLTGMKVIK